jgi:hypothetical protein
MDSIPEKVGAYTLGNPDKVRRALDGTPNQSGVVAGGVRKTDGTWDNAALLAEYDRIGGVILKGEDKVKTGSFYDFAARRPRDESAVVFVYRINGEVVEVAAEKEKPGKVKAAQQQAKAKKTTKKATKKSA